MFLVWHLESLFSLAFRAASLVWRSKPHLQFGVQSHGFSSSFRVIMSHFQFSVQSHIFNLAFRAVVRFQFSLQSHHVTSSVWHSKPLFVSSFGIQSHHRFLVTTFRVIIFSLTLRDVSSQFWRSELPSPVWRSEPPPPFSLAFRAISLVWAFRAIITLSFGVQSHYCFSVSAFIIIITSRF